jgi:hypothetical protein
MWVVHVRVYGSGCVKLACQLVSNWSPVQSGHFNFFFVSIRWCAVYSRKKVHDLMSRWIPSIVVGLVLYQWTGSTHELALAWRCGGSRCRSALNRNFCRSKFWSLDSWSDGCLWQKNQFWSLDSWWWMFGSNHGRWIFLIHDDFHHVFLRPKFEFPDNPSWFGWAAITSGNFRTVAFVSVAPGLRIYPPHRLRKLFF